MSELIRPEELRSVARTYYSSGFESLICLSGVDTMGMKGETEPKILVVYHLENMTKNEKVILRVALNRENPRVPTVSDIWKVANWHEREAFDMYGIIFEGHPNLTRILCCDDWVGYPLRKDYVFPTQYHGVPHARKPSGGDLSLHDD